MKTLSKSLVVEAALAGLFAAAFVMPAAAQDAPKGGAGSGKSAPTKKAPPKKAAEKVHCLGINSCKGKSECSVEGKTSCAGQNACKGQGWVSLSSAKKCKKAKGAVVGEKSAAAPAAPVAAPASK
jgi:hypothetical protein